MNSSVCKCYLGEESCTEIFEKSIKVVVSTLLHSFSQNNRMTLTERIYLLQIAFAVHSVLIMSLIEFHNGVPLVAIRK